MKPEADPLIVFLMAAAFIGLFAGAIALVDWIHQGIEARERKRAEEAKAKQDTKRGK